MKDDAHHCNPLFNNKTVENAPDYERIPALIL